MKDDIHRVLIIGSGPAGLTAAIYAARAQLAPVVIEGVESGGQLLTTSDVENYPGFAEAIKGPDLMDAMRRQALRFGAVLLPEMVEKIDFLEKPFRIWTDGQKVLTARSIIIATGSSHKWLGLDAEVRLRGRGVSACATFKRVFHLITNSYRIQLQTKSLARNMSRMKRKKRKQLDGEKGCGSLRRPHPFEVNHLHVGSFA